MKVISNKIHSDCIKCLEILSKEIEAKNDKITNSVRVARITINKLKKK